jgi:hypothetical protein
MEPKRNRERHNVTDTWYAPAMSPPTLPFTHFFLQKFREYEQQILILFHISAWNFSRQNKGEGIYTDFQAAKLFAFINNILGSLWDLQLDAKKALPLSKELNVKEYAEVWL